MSGELTQKQADYDQLQVDYNLAQSELAGKEDTEAKLRQANEDAKRVADKSDQLVQQLNK